MGECAGIHGRSFRVWNFSFFSNRGESGENSSRVMVSLGSYFLSQTLMSDVALSPAGKVRCEVVAQDMCYWWHVLWPGCRQPPTLFWLARRGVEQQMTHLARWKMPSFLSLMRLAWGWVVSEAQAGLKVVSSIILAGWSRSEAANDMPSWVERPFFPVSQGDWLGVWRWVKHRPGWRWPLPVIFYLDVFSLHF